MRPLRAVRRHGVRPIANDAFNKLERRARRYGMRSAPTSVTIEPTNDCNGSCLMCQPYRWDESLSSPPFGYLSWETLRALEPAIDRARTVLFAGFGEPLLHPEYTEMARWIAGRCPSVYMFTNGALMDSKIARELVDMSFDAVSFSVGGATDAIQRRIRGVSLDALHSGISALHEEKLRRGADRPRLFFNIVAMGSVLPELPDIVDQAADRGVEEIWMPTLWVESAEAAGEGVFGDPDGPAIAAAAEERADLRGVRLVPWCRTPSPQPCCGPWTSLVTAWDGTVFCCQHERYDMGNVLERPALDIWRSEGFARLRRDTSCAPEDVCPGCPTVCGTEEVYGNPALHGRHVISRFTDQGPERVEHRRVLD